MGSKDLRAGELYDIQLSYYDNRGKKEREKGRGRREGEGVEGRGGRGKGRGPRAHHRHGIEGPDSRETI